MVHAKQVCPPGLHFSLGIFYRLFSLLERHEDSSCEGGASYSHHFETLREIKELKPQLDKVSVRTLKHK